MSILERWCSEYQEQMTYLINYKTPDELTYKIHIIKQLLRLINKLVKNIFLS